MKNISLKRNINFDKKKDINDYELFSLKITDSLYKKRKFISFFNYFFKNSLSSINFLAANKNKKKKQFSAY